MLVIKSLQDPVEIRQLLTKDLVYRDMYKSMDEVGIDTNHTIWFKVVDGKKLIGIGLCEQLGHKVVTWHGAIYKKYRGANTAGYILEVLNILKKADVILTTAIPSLNLNARRLMPLINYKELTTFKSACVNGDDLILFGENI